MVDEYHVKLNCSTVHDRHSIEQQIRYYSLREVHTTRAVLILNNLY